ncbi:MAG: hypothetical protein AAFW73_14920 [Bacteroidota bacterium]
MPNFFYFGAGGLLLAFLLTACGSDKGKNIPDVSSIELNLNVQRFEKDLFARDTSDLPALMATMDSLYPDFFAPVFLGKILPPLQDPQVLDLFVKSEGLRRLSDTCQIVFGDFESYRHELETAFRYYRHYFPERSVPRVITYVSEYTLGNFTLEADLLGIGLDFFLGPNYPHYNLTFFPKYIQRSMTKEHLVSKTMQTVVKNMVGEPEGDRLLDIMINNGKSLYLLDQLLPYTPDSIKLEYSAAQVQWCDENEQQIWAHFLKEELLYATRLRDIRKLVDYSPSSPGMPPEAPGRTANWLGWQIVRSYMDRHPDASLEDLLALDDAQQLLERSKYKPRLR